MTGTWNSVDIIFQSLCIICMIFSCVLHFCNHYKFRCCSPKAHPNGHTKKRFVLIYNNMDSNNCCCCQIDIMYAGICSKISCILPKNTNLHCYPLCFLFYLIFCVSIAILTTILCHIQPQINIIMYMLLIYLIAVSILWEFFFNYYRYYSTIHCVQTLSNTNNTIDCNMFLRFFVYSLIFITLFTFLFAVNLQYDIIWWILSVVIICTHCISNCYFIMTFRRILLKQYEGIAELDANILQVINDSMMASVKSMQKLNLCTTMLSSLYLLMLLIAYKYFSVSYILKYYGFFWCVSSFMYCLNFAKNREFIKEKYFIFKQCFMKTTKYNLNQSVSKEVELELSIDHNIKNIILLQEMQKSIKISSDEKEETHSNKSHHSSPRNNSTLNTMKLRQTILSSSQSDLHIINKRKLMPKMDLLRSSTVNNVEDQQMNENLTLLNDNKQRTLSESTQIFNKINVIEHSNSLQSVFSVTNNQKMKLKPEELYKSMSANTNEIKLKDKDQELNELKTLFKRNAVKRSYTKAMEILGISARTDSMHTSDPDQGHIADDDDDDIYNMSAVAMLDFENCNHELVYISDDESIDDQHEEEIAIAIAIDISMQPFENINSLETNKSNKHKMQRSASYDLGAIDNELRKFGNFNSNQHSNRNSGKSMTDLMKNEKLKKELHEIHEMNEEIDTQNENMNGMVNLMYLMVKQGLYTSKNFNSVAQISRYNQSNGLF